MSRCDIAVEAARACSVYEIFPCAETGKEGVMVYERIIIRTIAYSLAEIVILKEKYLPLIE